VQNCTDDGRNQCASAGRRTSPSSQNRVGAFTHDSKRTIWNGCELRVSNTGRQSASLTSRPGAFCSKLRSDSNRAPASSSS